MRNISINIIAAALIVSASIGPAWAARGGGGSGHGPTVSAAAHMAHQSGQPVGASVRTVARSNSQGPSHASANAISHVQNSPGKANANSVLGTGKGGTAAGTGASASVRGTSASTSTSTTTQARLMGKNGKSRKLKH
jgi:hypothetical protein